MAAVDRPPGPSKAAAQPAKASTTTVTATAKAKVPVATVKPTPPPRPKLKPGALPRKLRPVVELEEYADRGPLGVLLQEGRPGAAVKPTPRTSRSCATLLIERHYPLVRYIAERLLQTLPKSIELDDLISAGLFGLMDAIRGFDRDAAASSSRPTAATRIRGSILDQLRSQDWVPRLVRLKAGSHRARSAEAHRRVRPRAHPQRARPQRSRWSTTTLVMRDAGFARQDDVLALGEVGGRRGLGREGRDPRGQERPSTRCSR